MAIIALRQIVNLNAPADNEDLIGHTLYLAAMAHFTAYLGHTGLALGYNACNAAVAIANHADYDGFAAAGVNFSAVYGTSRLYAGLDPDFNALHGNIAPTRPFSSSLNGEHAEQSAIRVVDNNPALALLNHGGHFHVYVDLNPCPLCTIWLNADPRNWFVHYRHSLNLQGPMVREKKDERKRKFGRIMEPVPTMLRRKYGINKPPRPKKTKGRPQRWVK